MITKQDVFWIYSQYGVELTEDEAKAISDEILGLNISLVRSYLTAQDYAKQGLKPQ